MADRTSNWPANRQPYQPISLYASPPSFLPLTWKIPGAQRAHPTWFDTCCPPPPMEIHFQQPQLSAAAKPGKMKSRGRGNHQGAAGSSKFVGVRQRPSGRWVAEIKDTTQKIRMWLGTFETAEEAARAYDEAACLLRGSNTRTNFVPRAAASNSPLAARIRGLLHHKKVAKGPAPAPPQPPPPSTFVPAASSVTMAASSPSSSLSSSSRTTTTTTATTASTVTICSNVSSSSTRGSSPAGAAQVAISHGENHPAEMAAPEVYRPCFGNGNSELHLGGSSSDFSWLFDSAGIERLQQFTQEGPLELPKHGVFEEGGEGLSELERMKVERQISASLYAINGVHEYLEAVHDPSDALWDLPPLCQLFCTS
ncbi:hypothetical protein Taro_032713 [Colocasia esculenta]|uniref:AP2/ERF domain-containing protein n=1 Tax=Colocasia esculenta TaxID=4460 RepID=A0A843VZT5_COLES|nr:hypothetical protein [Colocasia esculenta]